MASLSPLLKSQMLAIGTLRQGLVLTIWEGDRSGDDESGLDDGSGEVRWVGGDVA